MIDEDRIISSWHHLIPNFQTSALDFYASVEKGVEAWGIQEAHRLRVEHKEAGLASAKREYLRIHRGKHAFDICAAPFGTGYFISWWFTEPPLKFGFLYMLAFLFGLLIAMDIAWGFGFAVGVAMSGYMSGLVFGVASAAFGVPALLWLLGNAMRQGNIPGESTVLAIPLIGAIYKWIFAPNTFYAMDTAIMFQEAVHREVMKVYDCITENKGIRSLTEAERKPILKRFSAFSGV